MAFHSISINDQHKEIRGCWRTSPAVFNKLEGIFGFTIDACADRDNHLLPRYWTEEDDALTQDWSEERVFCNPPFGMAAKIVPKARTAKLAVILLPFTVLVSKYFSQNPPDVLLLPPTRWKYLPPPGLPSFTNSPLGTVALVYGPSPHEIDDLKVLGSVYKLT
ncbi:DNA N-6-adenine-methyltransferase [Zavarzinella formosa]|uniref:DNA N-6-adenine-methyltransferase n=1 Tax=Zavarzinella formosa TaxID=360055 RepID=UPI0002D63C92|nr:DNA N-6-adenine-methyltransferase [Zavarzinella formosa]